MENPRWLALSIATQPQWHALLRWLGDPDWAVPLRDAALAERRAAADEIDTRLRPVFAGLDRDRCVAELIEAGVPAAALADPRALHDHPQLQARGFFEPFDHPVVGVHPIMTLPYRFASLKRWLRTPAPTLGEHNRSVLGELGRTQDELDALEARGVIGTRPEGI